MLPQSNGKVQDFFENKSCFFVIKVQLSEICHGKMGIKGNFPFLKEDLTAFFCVFAACRGMKTAMFLLRFFQKYGTIVTV